MVASLAAEEVGASFSLDPPETPCREQGPDTEPHLLSGCLARAGDLGNRRPLPVLWLGRCLAPNKMGLAERRCCRLGEQGLGQKRTHMPGPSSSLGSPWIGSSDLLPRFQLGSLSRPHR